MLPIPSPSLPRPERALPLAFAFSLALAAAASATVPDAVTNAATPEAKGRAIAEEIDRVDLGFGDSKVKVRMVLKNAAGSTSERRMEIRTLEVPDTNEGDQTMVVFHEPDDVKGTALLTHAHIAEPDDQWLFLPALKRVKRISSVNKSGPFVGSEFAYEDFSATELEKYDYRLEGEEPCGELTCFVVRRIPRYEHSGYTSQKAWVDQTHYQLRKVEFFDRKKALLKTLVLDDQRLYLEKYWRAHTLRMQNHLTGKSTEFLYGDFEFRTGLDEGDFRKAALKRIR